MPHHVQQWETKIGTLSQREQYNHDVSKSDWIPKVKGVQTFSDAKFFNTVFVSGDDMVAEELAIKQREIDEWNKKIVVANKHFYVNTKPNESH